MPRRNAIIPIIDPKNEILIGPASRDDVIGQAVIRHSLYCGSYGMGGPGFFGLLLANELWLICCLWSAGAWIRANGRIISSSAGQEEPLVRNDAGLPKYDLLAPMLAVGPVITEFDFTGHSGRMIVGDVEFRIDEDPASRPLWAGSGQPRAFTPEDDLSRAWVLAKAPWVPV